MNATEFGDNKAKSVLLLHGGGLSWWNYREEARLLQDDFHVILPVLDGHAGSDRAFTSIEDNAGEIIRYIDEKLGGSILLIGGLSLGGQILLEMLSQRRDICRYALVESAAGHVALLNRCDFDDICLSLKCSQVPLTVAAYRLAAERFPYPLHLGVTETGTAWNGTIQSAVGIGTLLNEGIGDTLRVSLTADPVQEVKTGIAILKAAGLRRGGVKFVSCPTCGRTEIDLIGLAEEVERRLQGVERDITVAVMGCVVNGPGEAREADYGVAGGKGKGLLFKKGQVLGTYPYEELCDRLMDLILSEE